MRNAIDESVSIRVGSVDRSAREDGSKYSHAHENRTAKRPPRSPPYFYPLLQSNHIAPASFRCATSLPRWKFRRRSAAPGSSNNNNRDSDFAQGNGPKEFGAGTAAGDATARHLPHACQLPSPPSLPLRRLRRDAHRHAVPAPGKWRRAGDILRINLSFWLPTRLETIATTMSLEIAAEWGEKRSHFPLRDGRDSVPRQMDKLAFKICGCLSVSKLDCRAWRGAARRNAAAADAEMAPRDFL